MILHVYFGDALKHPIVQNYLRAGSVRPQAVLRYRLVRSKPLRFARLSLAMIQARVRQPAVIVQAHDFVSAMLATVLWGRRSIFDSHEIYSCLVRRRTVAWLVNRVERWVATRAGCVIYPSAERRDYYGSLKGSRPVVIENLYRPYAETLTGEDVRELGRLEAVVKATGQARYIYAGTMTEVRAIPEIVRAFDRPELRGHHLFLAGPRTALLDSILSVERENVAYLGEVRHAVMTALLPTFDAGFAIYKPSDANNRLAAPTKLFEYSYYGLAVIANRSTYVERVKSRDSLANVSFIEEISSEEVARKCLSVTGVARASRDQWRNRVLWQLQQPVIESMYQDVERLSCK